MVKIGFIRYWYCNSQNWPKYLVEKLNSVKESFQYVDAHKEEADIVLCNVFGLTKKDWVGNPVIINHTFEHPNNYKLLFESPYMISFYNDTENNLYYPQWQDDFGRIQYRNKYLEIASKSKTKFCTFMHSHSVASRNLCQKRDDVFKYISENYKRIDSCGPYLNNMPNKECCPRNFEDAVKFHLPYKFNLCFENTTSSDNLSYITEKISNAYWYNTVPIYAGSENVTKWFNPKSFINCNGLTIEEICNKVIEVDSDDSKYFNMLNEYPFIENIDYRDYSIHRMYDFLMKICKENNIQVE